MSELIRVLLFKEDGLWVAQGLEHDICVQGKTLEDVQTYFEVAIRLEDEEEGGVKRIPEAPRYFQERWEQRAGTYNPKSAKADTIEYGLAA